MTPDGDAMTLVIGDHFETTLDTHILDRPPAQSRLDEVETLGDLGDGTVAAAAEAHGLGLELLREGPALPTFLFRLVHGSLLASILAMLGVHEREARSHTPKKQLTMDEPTEANIRTCVLCGRGVSTGATVEDVIPQWFQRLTPQHRNSARAIIHRGPLEDPTGRIVMGEKADPQYFADGAVTVADVCDRPCNNNYMSRLQNKASALLKRMFVEGSPDELTDGECSTLLRWCLMTGFFWQKTRPNRREVVPMNHALDAIHNGKLPKGLHLVLGRDRRFGDDFACAVEDVWYITCYNSGSFAAVRSSQASYRIVFRLGRALFAAVYVPPESSCVPALMAPLHRLAWPKRAEVRQASWHNGPAELLNNPFIAFTVGLGLCSGEWRDVYVLGQSQPNHAAAFRKAYLETRRALSQPKGMPPGHRPATGRRLIMERSLPMTVVAGDASIVRMVEGANGNWVEQDFVSDDPSMGDLVVVREATPLELMIIEGRTPETPADLATSPVPPT